MNQAYAAIFNQAGTPHRLEPQPIPELAEGETLVKILCCALCRSDLSTYLGRRIEPTPTILGHEIIGEVIASRSEAKVGQRVTWSIAASCGTCHFCTHDLPQKCATLFKYGHQQVTPESPISGGLATHILLRKGTKILEIPADLPDELAVLANCSTATAAAVVRASNPQFGDVVVIFGAGILGATAAAFLTELGCKAVIFDPSTEAAERAIGFGAISAHSDLDSLKSNVETLTQGRGADVCLELSGAKPAAEQALQLTRTGGTIIWAGTVSPVGVVEIHPDQFVRRTLTLKGVHNYAPQDLRTALAFLERYHTKYPFASFIGQSFPLSQVEAAFQSALSNPAHRALVQPGLQVSQDFT